MQMAETKRTGLVLSLCDYTGNMVRPWAEAGYECHCFDLRCPQVRRVEFASGGSINHHMGDLSDSGCRHALKADFREPVIKFAFPSCTNLAVSGARWFKGKGMKGLIEGLTLVEACRELCEESGAAWMLENPVSTLSTYWRKPDYIFHPFEYAGYEGGAGDTYTKKTCLWTGGGFVMPDRKAIAATDTRIHLMPPSEDRGHLRSITPQGFARAVFEANSSVFEREMVNV